MMPSDDTIKSACEGITQAVMTFTLDQIKSFVQRFKDKNLVFVKDQETISLVKEQKKSSEWEIYNKYVTDKELRLLVQMGLALRKLETKPELLHSLRDKIRDKYGTPGLHRAQLVQNEILSVVIGITASKHTAHVDLAKSIENLLKDVEQYVIFISTNDDVKRRVQELTARIYALQPQILILYGAKSAINTVNSICEELESVVLDRYEIIKQESATKVMLFFRKDDK